MKRDVAIFGAGEWGKLAFYYYKDKCNISCFIDNDKRIWGTQIFGIPVFSPDHIRGKQLTIVIANKRFQNEIMRQLYNHYGIKEVICFGISEKTECLSKEDADLNNTSEVIIEFRDGLGNQMFQYALYKSLEVEGKNVKADLSEYCKPWMAPFLLEKVFPLIKLNVVSPQIKDYYINKGCVYYDLSEKQAKEKLIFEKKLYEMDEGYISGWHVSYMYPEKIKNQLLEVFKFDIDCYSKLKQLIDFLKCRNTVSVQIRRGDFLSPQYYRELGCHCNEEYYKKAIDEIKKKVDNPVFVFLSDDIVWVKQTFSNPGSIYIEKEMFDEYYDWFDMCIMSNCKHNIIANSTFGWWGAWLNQNTEKIVISPKRWRTSWDFADHCPPDWIRI